MYLLRIISVYMDVFFAKQDMTIDYDKPPYFCNSIFAIKPERWKDLLTDGTPRHGPFDEVALNLYRRKHNMKMGFIRRGYCAHTAYGPNQYSPDLVEAEKDFVDGVHSWLVMP
jgi:hypothetical protein